MQNNFILADGRWQGTHGIARFSREVLSRLQHADIFTNGPSPLSLQNIFWQNYFLATKKPYHVYFTPGFNPTLISSLPVVFTIHDLIHLHVSNSFIDKTFYELLMKPAAKKAQKILTVSEYSRQTIINWANVSPEKVVMVSSAVSPIFSAQGEKFTPNFPYLLHVGNMKEHKNVARIIQAMTIAKIDPAIKLICTGTMTPEIITVVKQHNFADRLVIYKNLSESQLTTYYRGALGVVFPSLYEGFGLPVIEGMASGVPVLTSNITSMPEIAGNAAILVDPYSIDAIADGITQLVNDHALREDLIAKGLQQCKKFSWERTAEKVQVVLDKHR